MNRPKIARMATKPGRAAALRRARIMVVDDHPLTRAGVVDLIDKQADLEVCCQLGGPAEAFSAITKQRPDLLLTDMTMPGRAGIEFVKDVVALDPDLPILILSMHDEMIYAERALRAGGRGYIMKDQGGEKLLMAIRRVLSGQIYVSDRMSATILDHLTDQRPRGSNSPIAKLSDRQFEIFRLIGQGKSSRAIADQLHLSAKTVDTHRMHIKEKLDIEDAVSLVCHAVRWVQTNDEA
jgi:DNA-binding NarL/FixJ family response regulator